MKWLIELRWSAIAMAVLVGCQTAPPPLPAPPTTLDAVGELRAGSGFPKGYLDTDQLPDSLMLLPAPPAAGSAQAAADLAAYRSSRALRDTPRWGLAAQEANYKSAAIYETLACALDSPITPAATPHLHMLLRRTLVDAGRATNRAKQGHQRPRPYAAQADASCYPTDDAELRSDGSYPSGHAAFGWAWALVLAELAPERANALLQRGYAIGAGRVVCGMHWPSDVEAGRVVGAAAVARLHADATFRAQAALAKAEIDAARARGLKPARDCAAEAGALAQ